MAKKIREKSKVIDKSRGKIFYKTGENPVKLQVLHSSTSPWVMGGGRLSHFSEHSYRKDLGQIGILGGNWPFRWG